MSWFKPEVPTAAPLGSLLSSEKETNFGEDASINWIAQESQSSVERIISKKEVIQLYLDTILYHPKLMFSMDVIQVLSSFFVVILYIWSSYFSDENPTWMNALEYFFAVAFILDFFYQFFTASSKLTYLVTVSALIDLVTVIPVFVRSEDKKMLINLNFLRFTKMIRILNILNANQYFLNRITAKQRQIFLVGYTLISLIFSAAGFFHILERDPNTGERYLYHEAIYFIVVTISTVGYGDITPTTTLGRLVIVSFLILTIILIPMETGRLQTLIAQTTIHDGSYTETHEHVILVGHITATSVEDFLMEFFSEERRKQDPPYVVIIYAEPPSAPMRAILTKPKYEGAVFYFKGTALSDGDLSRCKAEKASAAFIFANQYSKNPDEDDKANILRALSIKRHNSKIQILMQLISRSNKKFAQKYGEIANVFTVHEFKLGLMAKTVLYPGFSTLVTNLISTNPYSSKTEAWHKEYVKGRTRELFTLSIPKYFTGKTFTEVAVAIFSKFETLLIGLEIQDDDGETYISLNPSEKYVIKGNEIGFVISDNVRTVMGIQESFGSGGSRKKARSSQWKITKGIKGPHNHHRLNICTHDMTGNVAQDILYIIASLRSKNLPIIRDIVILNTRFPDEELAQQIAGFMNIYFVQGSHISLQDLLKAGIDRADSILILAQTEKNADDNETDSDNILSYMLITNHLKKNLNTVVELVINNNMKFVTTGLSEEKVGEDFKLLSSYAAGKVYTSAMLRSLISKSFYNPFVTEILKLWILYDGKEEDRIQSGLYQVDLPSEFAGRTFGVLFETLIKENNMLPIALYRGKEAKGSPHPYVFTLPPRKTILHANDKVFVLSEANPYGEPAEQINSAPPTPRLAKRNSFVLRSSSSVSLPIEQKASEMAQKVIHSSNLTQATANPIPSFVVKEFPVDSPTKESKQEESSPSEEEQPLPKKETNPQNNKFVALEEIVDESDSSDDK